MANILQDILHSLQKYFIISTLDMHFTFLSLDHVMILSFLIKCIFRFHIWEFDATSMVMTNLCSSN